LEAPLPAITNEVVHLDTLVRFVEHPVRAFLRERLGIYARDRSDEINDDLPIELDGLERWAVGDRVLTARMCGATPERAVAAERARGLLPPGSLGTEVLDRVSPTVEAVVSVVAGLPVGSVTPQSIEVNLALADGRRLIGTVDGLRETVILRAVYSRLGPKHRLAAWVRHLAVAAAFPELSLISITVGRGRPARGDQQFVAQSTFGVPPVTGPLDRLATLVDLYDRGMREPLPIYCNTSAAWVASKRSGHDQDRVEESARREWTQRDLFAGEDHDGEHRLVLGGVLSFDQIKGGHPAAGESGPGWDDTEATRFGRLASRLWSDLLGAEDWRELS
jgi:exodeoxyribonuclease V gamma subunit